MNKILITGLVAIAVIAGGLMFWQSNNGTSKSEKSGDSLSSQSQMNMPDMRKQFEGYKGAQYDKIFLASMTAHHQGAVQMAQMALSSAKHQEIKDLAANIVNDQNAEISQMQSWQTALGYTSNDSATQAVVKQMQSEMDSMMSQLTGKTGDDFDKAFIAQMTMHHQSAIAMSQPAAKNASEQDVKKLAANIITAQTKEISEMMSWQVQWGYEVQNNSPDSMSGMSM